jgi:2-polyprenyl-3-methyl-5-hydroxy-6-metoxy-1,4-benzoquinol methylase
MDRQAHWEAIYTTRDEREVSWFQPDPGLSLDFIRAVAPEAGRVIDVGGGASLLVDRLLDSGFEHVAVLDISRATLEKAKARLGERASRVRWIQADVTTVASVGEFDVWHDRAAFHFLTDPADRRRYVALAERSLPPGGHLIVATFAREGPSRCSGLEVCRYDARSLGAELGQTFSLVREATETHITPRGSPHAFFYGVFRRHES